MLLPIYWFTSPKVSAASSRNHWLKHQGTMMAGNPTVERFCSTYIQHFPVSLRPLLFVSFILNLTSHLAIRWQPATGGKDHHSLPYPLKEEADFWPVLLETRKSLPRSLWQPSPRPKLGHMPISEHSLTGGLDSFDWLGLTESHLWSWERGYLLPNHMNKTGISFWRYERMDVG